MCLVIDLVRQLPKELWFSEEAMSHDTSFSEQLLAFASEKTLLILDRGFYDFTFFARLVDQGTQLITRLKANAIIETVRLLTKTDTLRGTIIRLGSGQKGAPILTMRLIEVRVERIWHPMENTGVQRFICLSSMGIGDSKDMLPFLYKYILVPLLLKQGFAEHELQENAVKQSRTKWTIVRPGELSDKKAKGVYRHGLPVIDKTIKGKVSRADVADFVLKQLNNETYLRQAPWVSY
jgi:hypothetical protein